MTVNKIKNKAKIIYNDSDLSIACPYGKSPKVSSYGCQNCNYFIDKNTSFSVYCTYELEEDEHVII